METLKPGELVGTNKDSYLILEKLPTEFDNRVKAMEVDEKPTEDYSDIGGLEKQIQELIEAVVLPMTHAEKFEAIGIQPPKGVLLHGPPGTGKTLLARACANKVGCGYVMCRYIHMSLLEGRGRWEGACALAVARCVVPSCSALRQGAVRCGLST